MLRMLQKVIWGGTDNPDQSYLKDLSLREIVTLAPLLVFVFWIGLAPKPFMDVMHTSVAHLLTQVHGAQGTAQVAQILLP